MLFSKQILEQQGLPNRITILTDGFHQYRAHHGDRTGAGKLVGQRENQTHSHPNLLGTGMDGIIRAISRHGVKIPIFLCVSFWAFGKKSKRFRLSAKAEPLKRCGFSFAILFLILHPSSGIEKNDTLVFYTMPMSIIIKDQLVFTISLRNHVCSANGKSSVFIP